MTEIIKPVKKIFTVVVDKVTFYMLDQGPEVDGEIRLLFQSLKAAQNFDNTSEAFAIVMPQDEVIQYGKTLGFIKNKKQLSKKFVEGKIKKQRSVTLDDTSEAERLTCR